ncbi:MAG: flagellar hook-length control protein FliK [Planctomycetota bacterium]
MPVSQDVRPRETRAAEIPAEAEEFVPIRSAFSTTRVERSNGNDAQVETVIADPLGLEAARRLTTRAREEVLESIRSADDRPLAPKSGYRREPTDLPVSESDAAYRYAKRANARSVEQPSSTLSSSESQRPAGSAASPVPAEPRGDGAVRVTNDPQTNQQPTPVLPAGSRVETAAAPAFGVAAQAIATPGKEGTPSPRGLEVRATSQAGAKTDTRGTKRAQDPAPPTPRDTSRAFRQAARGLAKLATKGGGQLTLSLRPDSVGEVKVDLTIKNGAVSATLRATTDIGQEVLGTRLAELRGVLESRGLTVEQLGVERVEAVERLWSAERTESASSQHNPRGDRAEPESRGDGSPVRDDSNDAGGHDGRPGSDARREDARRGGTRPETELGPDNQDDGGQRDAEAGEALDEPAVELVEGEVRLNAVA